MAPGQEKSNALEGSVKLIKVLKGSEKFEKQTRVLGFCFDYSFSMGGLCRSVCFCLINRGLDRSLSHGLPLAWWVLFCCGMRLAHALVEVFVKLKWTRIFFSKGKGNTLISPTIFGRHLFFLAPKQPPRMSPGVWKLRWSLADFVEMEKNLGYFETRCITFSGTSPGFGISSQHFLAIFPTSLRQDIPSLYLPEGSWWRSRIFFWRWNSPPVTRREKEFWSSGSVQTWQRHDCNFHTSYFSQVTSNPCELQVRSISNSGSTFNGKKSPRNQMKIHHL